MTSHLSEEMDFVTAFRDAWRRIQRLSEKNLATIGISVTELRILKLLSVNGPLPMTRFASEFYMTPASVTGLVDRLEGDGLVERERLSGDRRVIHVSVTQSGRERLAAGLKLNNLFAERVLGSLSKEQQKELIRLLDKLAQAAAE
jgi:DNA-binding MarR family transcriptional regulator